MRAVVVVVVLPLLQFLGEQAGVVDDLALEKAVELFGVDAVGSFDLAVEPRCARFDANVVDAFIEQVPVEGGAEFGAVVCLDPLDGEGEFGHDVVDEGDGSLLVAARVGAQHSQSGAVIDRGELVVLLPAAGLA
jgi:hypothetical protein